MQEHNDNKALSIFFVLSLALHIFLVLLLNFEALEALFAGSGNNYSRTNVQYVRLSGSGTPANKGAEKTPEVSQPAQKPAGNVEDKPAPPTNKVVVEPVKTVQKTATTPAPEKPGKPVQPVPTAPQKVEAPKPDPVPPQLPQREAPPEIEVVTSETSTFEIDMDAITKEAKGQAIPEEGTEGNTSEKTGSPDGEGEKLVPPKGDDYMTNIGGSGGFTTKNIESLEYTGELEMIFEVDSEGNLTVVLVKGLGEERFNSELVNYAQRTWRGRFDAEARSLFPSGYQVPVLVVFEKGNGTHRFGDVQPLE
ncbi:MAG: hypothetical protein PHC96_01350 [Firmicutes bacterium]|nr:hypothetical protein [Bacillota bacterium]